VTKEQLLTEVEDVLRTMPPGETVNRPTPDSLAWRGRAAAVVALWSGVKAVEFDAQLRLLNGEFVGLTAIPRLITILHQARFDLQMQTVGPMTTVIGQGRVFDYFDEIRKVITEARQDLLFVDPYLDADFVSRYLVHVASEVEIRLLSGEKRLATLLPSVEAFVAQHGARVQVRSAKLLHDRYVFVDRSACYQSGTSFKDGARNAPTTLTQITDAFVAMWDTYDALWNRANVQRP
jgi:hypothetical protein